jgi:DNA-binding transcriptional LysR family regulator
MDDEGRRHIDRYCRFHHIFILVLSMNGTSAMNLSGLSLRDLEYVVAIADHGSFVRAAEHCGVAQPSLSAQVRKLETWLGIAIFERTTRRVIVTTEGKPFIDQARRVLAEARLLFTIAQHSDESPLAVRCAWPQFRRSDPTFSPGSSRDFGRSIPTWNSS